LTRARFLVSSIELDRGDLQLRSDELRHLRARRLRAGAEIVLTDGEGRQRRGTIERITRQYAQVRLDQSDPAIDEAAPPGARLELAQAVLKADKLDLVIEKATELGVSSLIVFTSSRCVARPVPERLARWQRIARSAAKQCQRSAVPLIRGPVAFDEVLDAAPSRRRLLFWEGAGSARLNEADVLPASGLLAVVGPEGGFDPVEVAGARKAGFQIVGLGPRILRAETAAIVAVTLCQRLWGDL
jgi:16S rRNA (uracil1498-N3)-methyltransferase